MFFSESSLNYDDGISKLTELQNLLTISCLEFKKLSDRLRNQTLVLLEWSTRPSFLPPKTHFWSDSIKNHEYDKKRAKFGKLKLKTDLALSQKKKKTK